MMGQTIKAGTGICDILLDEEKLIKELKNIELTEDDFLQVNDQNIHSLLEDDEEGVCDDDDFEFDIN